MGEEVDVPALLSKEFEIGDRRLAARQDDEVGDWKRFAGLDDDEPHGRLHAQRVEIIKICDARQHRHGDGHRAFRPRLFVAKAERVFRRETRCVGEERQEAEGPPVRMRFERHHTAEEQVRVAAELVDDEADYCARVVRRERRFDAENLGEYAATIDIADQRHGAAGGARESHIGDIALAQVDLGCAARALDEHEIGVRSNTRVAVEHGAHQFGLQGLIFCRAGVADDLALDDDLRADFALRLEQHRVHVHARGNSACARLQRLGAADLAAVVRHRGVVRHVLRLERADAKPAPGEGAA